jgi:NADH:ubiquinone reductase (H+-translocating)
MSSPTPGARVPNVVVVGAGFAGVHVVKGLRRARANIAVFDRHNYHLFQPLLYQVASAALSPGDIAYPIRRIFRSQANVQVILGEVSSIDLKRKVITVQGVEQDYDYLVIATGSTHSYFGKDEWARTALGLKTVDDALAIRKRVLTAFEDAENECDEASRRAKLTFIVVGGGPTGVELAGALREIAVNDIQKDFRNIDTSTARVMLIEANERLIKQFSQKSSDRAKRDLEKMGIELRLNSRVTEVDSTGLEIGSERINAQNIFWAAGVQASSLSRTLGAPLDRAGRVQVLPDLSVPGHPEVFVAGDLASLVDPKTQQPVPGLAPAAMQMGKHIARVLRTELESGPRDPSTRQPFRYFDKGMMATIGKNKAVAEIWKLKIGGFIAWAMWGVVHLMFLISFRSKVFVMWTWIWNYVFTGRSVRLITGESNSSIRKVRDVTPSAVPMTPAPQIDPETAVNSI